MYHLNCRWFCRIFLICKCVKIAANKSAICIFGSLWFSLVFLEMPHFFKFPLSQKAKLGAFVSGHWKQYCAASYQPSLSWSYLIKHCRILNHWLSFFSHLFILCSSKCRMWGLYCFWSSLETCSNRSYIFNSIWSWN